MNLKLGEEYFYWGTSLPPDIAISTGIAAYKIKYDALPTVVFCHPTVFNQVENLPIGLVLAINERLNSHVFAFDLPRKQ
jgi:hypothetical protein